MRKAGERARSPAVPPRAWAPKAHVSTRVPAHRQHAAERRNCLHCGDASGDLRSTRQLAAQRLWAWSAGEGTTGTGLLIDALSVWVWLCAGAVGGGAPAPCPDAA